MSDRLVVGDHGDRAMQRAIEEPPLDLSLSLGLGNNNMAHESSSSLTFESLKANDQDSGVAPNPAENSNDQEVMKQKKQQFPCKYCDKKFPTTQALGGHQNAHRRERFLQKIKKEIDHINSSGLGARLFPYPAMANHLPYRSSPLYHGGHHMQPQAQMSASASAMPWRHFGHGYGNQGLHRRSLSWQPLGMTSNSLGESAETPILNRRNVGFGYEYPSLAVDAANRAIMARADHLGGFQLNPNTRN